MPLSISNGYKPLHCNTVSTIGNLRFMSTTALVFFASHPVLVPLLPGAYYYGPLHYSLKQLISPELRSIGTCRLFILLCVLLIRSAMELSLLILGFVYRVAGLKADKSILSFQCWTKQDMPLINHSTQLHSTSAYR